MGLEEIHLLSPNWQECSIMEPADQDGPEKSRQLVAFPQSDRPFPTRDRYRFIEVVKRRREYCKTRELSWSSELSEADGTNETERSGSEELSDSDSKFKTPVLIRTLILALIRVQILAPADGGENLLIDAPGPRKSPEPSSTYRASKSESSSRSSKSSKSSKSGQHKDMVKPRFMGTVKHYMTDGSIQSRENSLKKTRTEIKEKGDKRKEVKKQERSAKKTSKLEALYRKIEKLKKEEKKLKKGIEAFEKW